MKYEKESVQGEFLGALRMLQIRGGVVFVLDGLPLIVPVFFIYPLHSCFPIRILLSHTVSNR